MTITRTLTTLALTALFTAPALAQAEKPRQTALKIEKYRTPYQVERIRTPSSPAVRFSAQPAEVEEAAVLLVEVHAVAGDNLDRRYRCVALRNLDECIGSDGIRLPYAKRDEAMVLTISAEPKNSPEGLALRAEALRSLLAQNHLED